MALQYTEKRPTVYRARARVAAIAIQGNGFASLTLTAPTIAQAARPGQFVTVVRPSQARPLRTFDTPEAWAAAYRAAPSRAPDSPPLLRRPISIHRATTQGQVTLLIRAVGRGTRELAALGPDDYVDVLGPMGNGFELSGDYETAILVAGGAGLAPMLFLAESLHRMGKKLVIIAGVKEDFPMPMTVFSDLGAEVLLASESPIKGVYHGLCSEPLEQFLSRRRQHGQTHRAFACGPWPMLRRVAELCAQHNVPLQVSLEQRMGCALGACMACVRKVLDHDGRPQNLRVCTEGPVFDAQKVKWDECG